MITLQQGGAHFLCAETGTEAASHYFLSSFEDFRLFTLIIESIGWADYVDHIVGQSRNTNEPFFDGGPLDLAKTKPGVRTQTIRIHEQRFLELFLVKLVDTFQVYLRDLLKNILSIRPEILSDRQVTLSVGEILSHGTLDSLVAAQLDEKLTSLSYFGFDQLRTWCDKRGIEIQIKGSHEARVIELIAARNAITHNRGLIDARYLTAVPDSPLSVGDLRSLRNADLRAGSALFAKIIEATDLAVAEKFGLELLSIPELLPVQGLNEPEETMQSLDDGEGKAPQE